MTTRRYLPLLATIRNVMTNGALQWVILALWKISDYKASRGLDCSAYMVRDIYCVSSFSLFL